MLKNTHYKHTLYAAKAATHVHTHWFCSYTLVLSHNVSRYAKRISQFDVQRRNNGCRRWRQSLMKDRDKDKTEKKGYWVVISSWNGVAQIALTQPLLPSPFCPLCALASLSLTLSSSPSLLLSSSLLLSHSLLLSPSLTLSLSHSPPLSFSPPLLLSLTLSSYLFSSSSIFSALPDCLLQRMSSFFQAVKRYVGTIVNGQMPKAFAEDTRHFWVRVAHMMG